MRFMLAIRLAFLATVALACAGCPLMQSDELNNVSHDGGVHATENGGLSIYGELTINKSDPQNMVDPFHGPLELGLLQTAILTRCYDSLFGENATGATKYFCKNEDIAAGSFFGDGTPEEMCIRDTCMQSLMTCIGFANLEIAENTGVWELETTTFDFQAVVWGDWLYSMLFWNTGSSSYTRLSSMSPSGGSKVDTFYYRIPPLSDANKTLAYRAAHRAFQEAAIRGSRATEWQGPSCLETLEAESILWPSEDGPSIIDFYVVGLAESMKMFGEATNLLVNNQLNVASASAREPDFSQAQTQQWTAQYNSHSAALRHLVGYTGDATELPVLCEPCATELSRASHKVALSVLRRARLADTFDKTITDSQLLPLIVEVTYSDLGLSNVPDGDDFLTDRGIGLSDVGVARKYLQQEYIAYDRVHTVDASAITGPARLHGMAKPSSVLPPAFYLGKALGQGEVNYVQDGAIYAMVGSIQTVDYLRIGINRLQKAAVRGSSGGGIDVSTDSQKVLASASIAAEQMVGSRRLLVGINANGMSGGVGLFGASADDKMFLADKLHARCLIEGSDDGAPCPNPGQWVISTQSQYYEAPLPAGPLDNLLLVSVTDVGSATEIAVFLGSLGGQPALIGTFKWEPGLATSWPVGGTLADDLVSKITNRDKGHCGLSQNICGDFDLLRGYVPPLENELTEDANPYENSWHHYLVLAKDAAAEADRLGEQLVEYGLQNDLRADEARRQMEEICGGVVSLPDIQGTACNPASDPNCSVDDAYKITDPSLAQCLPGDLGGAMERIPFTSLGSRVCVYRWNQSGRYCACSEAEENARKCTRECPAIYTGAYGNCEDQFRALHDVSFAGVQWGADPSQTEEATFLLVDRSLNVFAAPHEQVGVPDCTKVHRLRLATQNWSLQNSAEIRAAVNELTWDEWWVKQSHLQNLSNNLSFESEPLHHYTVRYNGSVLWSTKKESEDDCPTNPPWAEGGHLPITCYKEWITGPEDWLLNSLGDDLNSVVKARMAWGDRMKRTVMALGLLSGSPRITTGRIAYSEIPAFKDVLSYAGGVEFPVRLNNGSVCVGGSCLCIDTEGYSDLLDVLETEYPGDPDLLPCTDQGGGSYLTRYDCQLRYVPAATNESQLGVFWFNGLADFLANGVLPFESTPLTWTGTHNECDGVVNDISLQGYWNNNSPTRAELRVDTPQWAERDIALRAIDVPLLMDVLDLSCYLSRRGSTSSCSPGQELPQVNGRDDLDKVARAITCQANEIHKMAETLVLPNLPRVLVDNFQSGGTQGYYPGWQGENLDVLLGIESDLRTFSASADSIRDIMIQAAALINRVYLNLDNNDIAKRLEEIRAWRNFLNTFAKFGADIANVVGSRGASLFGIQAFLTGNAKGLDSDEDALRLEEISNNRELILSQALTDTTVLSGQLRTQGENIKNSYSSIQSNLNKLDRLQKKASEAWANMLFLDSDAAGHVFPVNTVMRRRQNTTRKRYEQASIRAKKLAYIARRAIEFRLGVDMTKMTQPMTLVAAPSEWVDRICEMQGFDYERIRAAAASEDASLFDPETNEQIDDYAHMYIGDYVTQLQDFVESYVIDYPFTDESDTAVLSLRDDILRTRGRCLEDSHNLLYYSDDLSAKKQENGLQLGWAQAECAASDPLCLTVAETEEATPYLATRIQDTPMRWFNDAESNRPGNHLNSGYVSQTVTGLSQGDYILSWYGMRPADSVSTIRYEVEVYQIGETSPVQTATVDATDWARHWVSFDLDSVSDVEIRFYPSNVQLTESYGDVIIGGVQLEWVDPNRTSFFGTLTNVPPIDYEPVRDDRLIRPVECPDYDGSAMRERFIYRCICIGSPNGECSSSPSDLADQKCFYQSTFTLNLRDIESGDIIPSENIALGNFNYRHDTIAVNIVGTNVRDCAASETPSSCYANSFVPYTLEHAGEVWVRNHEWNTESFMMPDARIEHGKALSAEVLLTNPIMGTHSTLLAAYWKDGLRGRPLQGQYVVRIWATPELNWTAVEDIQLVWKYRYWTRMGTGY